MKILLICNAGMSTGILQMKLEEEAQKLHLDAEVLAIPMSEIDDHIKDSDAVLLGPQIRFAYNDVRKMVSEDKPVMVIAAQDFGIMNAEKIMNDLVEELNK
ncbi:PTS system cellobiose-specific IIB component [Breznakia sp. PF5-3]|uniref:PTS sugar transporter subunit IIB n=1 Tax=unclassified Breznakia TaxID=2623764 RepID=UPI002404A51C|nr:MULTISPECIES: PTS sugar transporter subunit IIB [unclassified Breznakia]MDF9824525.1 PTS system cellobiose-specific IIB component [Breznakia sp. PM6-1]MDF9835311.1 PTS system cellobiose-specific IIB component [Breznakia sp. PF5-3]MDF9837027.1 PTS system cellobiose-specific IIB component [Breznakia sp. PFB2-8]MDF9858952.1 PTS system cellobiose-specific IIB component [Breznakia sp. PH5-24]